MKEERMFILKMVQEGKITADEAVKLLDSISSNHSKSDTIRQVRDKANGMLEDAKPVVKKYANKATRVLNDVVDAFKEGVDNFNNKPKKSDFTDDVIDDVSDDFVVYDGSDDEPDMIDEIKKNADEKSHKISESVKENTSAVKETMKEAAKSIKESAKDMKDTVNIVAMDIKEKAENVKDDIEDAMKK